MLGRTAGGLFWMSRYLERAESTARLVDAGFRIALTRTAAAEAEWASILATAAAQSQFLQRYERVEGASAVNFLLRDRDSLKLEPRRRIEQDDPYYQLISSGWGEALRKAFQSLPAYKF